LNIAPGTGSANEIISSLADQAQRAKYLNQCFAGSCGHEPQYLPHFSHIALPSNVENGGSGLKKNGDGKVIPLP
jgi:hypothetical protein